MKCSFVDALDDTQAQELCELYQHEWWTKGRTLAEVKRLLAGNGLFFGAVDPEGRLIGFARVLSDGVYKALVFDVIVAARHRGAGLGRQIMERIAADPRVAGVKHLELYCLPERSAFYNRLGFNAELGELRLVRRTN